MRNFKCKLAFLGLLALACGANEVRAVPSAARVKKDLMSKGVLSVKLVGNGRKSWSSTYSQYFWEQSAVVVRKAGIPEFPNAKLEVGGIARYTYAGGSFPFNRFLVTYNSYSGIPAPSAKTIVDMVKKDLPSFLGHHYNQIVGDVGPIALAANPKWNWHRPTSVSMLVTTSFTEKVSNTQMEKKKVTYEVRLYRDAIKAPWKTFHSSSRDEVVLAKSTHEADDLAAMKTLAMVNAERGASSHMSGLPDVAIPHFKSDLEAFAFIHKTMRESDPKKFEAILRRLMAPHYYVAGSKVLLDTNGEAKVQETVKTVFGSKVKYADQYGPDPIVAAYQNGILTLGNADGQHISRIRVQPAGGEYKDGVKVNQTFKITDIEIYVAKDEDTIARLKSMPPAQRFAAPQGARTFSQLGQQAAVEQKQQVQAAVIKAVEWVPFTSTNARLKASFPGIATETEGKMNDKYPMWTVEAKHPQILARAISIIYPKALNRMQAQQTVQSALQELSKANNMTIKDTSEVGDGAYGMLAKMEAADTVITARVWAQGDVLYQLILGGTPATMATLSGREFFGSFQPLR